MEEQRPGRICRSDEQARRHIGDDDDGNHPTEDKFEEASKDDIWVSAKIEQAVISVDQSLRANNPKARDGQTEEDAIMDHDTHGNRQEVEDHLRERRNYRELDLCRSNESNANQSVNQIVETELLCGDGKLCVDRLKKHEVETACPNQFREIGKI